MNSQENRIIPFASGIISVDLDHRLLFTEDAIHPMPDRQFVTLQPLALRVGELVTNDTLITATAPETSALSTAQYRQLLRVQSYIGGLRKTFDKLIDGLGDPKEGAIRAEWGKGFLLLDTWEKSDLSTEDS